MESLPEKIIERIQKEDIKPSPRWVFTAREVLLWCLVALCLIFAAIILVTDIYFLRDIGIDILPEAYPAVWRNIIIPISSAWLLIVLATLLAVYIYYTRTEGGYRSRRRVVLPLSASIVILLGLLLHATGYGRLSHDYARSYVPAYRVWHEETKRAYWMHPEAGLLTGTFLTNPSGTSLVLIDEIGRQWNIRFTSNTIWEGGVNSATGDPVRLIGTEDGPGFFVARTVRPFATPASSQ